MKKIVFLNDFLVHDCCWQATYHRWIGELIEPLIKQTTHQDMVYVEDLRNKDNHLFSRTLFYEKSGIKDVPLYYFSCDMQSITKESIDYLSQFIDSETFVIGVELSLELRHILTNLGINFINFWFHSYKLFDDVCFMINTNNQIIYQKLQKYKIPQERFYFYANYWKIQIREQKKLSGIQLEENSILFVGQTFMDKSILKDGVYQNILNYKKELEELSYQYTKIYYAPHPLVANVPEVDDFISQTPYMEKIENVPSYVLLTAPEIKKVVGISSSVLYEAHFFGKETTYLYQPLFDIDAPFDLNSFTSVYNDYFNPYFWSNILSDIFETNKNVLNQILFMEDKNKIRNIRDLYWGYSTLDNYAEFSLKKEIQTDTNMLLFKQQQTIKEQMDKQAEKQQNEKNELIQYIEIIKQNIATITATQEINTEAIQNEIALYKIDVQNLKKYLHFLIRLISCFIFKKKNRDHFRKKYMKPKISKKKSS